jgi:class 3 adenylate cyclase/pimeloyl-ACP methyl ester carboxylesterase
MEAPRFHYVKTADGLNIAYWVLGQGPPLLFLAIDACAVFSLEAWREPAYRGFLESLAEKHQVIGLHPRGVGLSDRCTDFSLEMLILDLEAVMDRLGLERFPVFANWHFGLLALSYALRRPERISQIILWCAYANGADAFVGSRAATIVSLRDKDYDLYVETLVGHFVRSPDPGKIALFSTLFGKNFDQETAKNLIGELAKIDLTGQLGMVSQPTVVMQPSDHKVFNQSTGRMLAAGIPNSRFLYVDGDVWVPSFNENDALVAAIKQALEPADATTPKGQVNPGGGVQTILFTDIEGHTAMMQRLGDAKGREVLREHERVTRSALSAHGGTEVKTMGDGFMASFTSAQKAVECAIALQRAFADRTGEPIRIRVGMNSGEPIAEDNDLFGSAVILAARAAAKASGGEILVTDVVRHLVAGKGFLFSDRGETTLRGFEDPVRLLEVNWK